MLALQFTDTISLGALIIAAVITALGGIPVRLIKALRLERDEYARVNQQQAVELAELRTRPDLTKLSDEQRELHLATIEAIRDIAHAAQAESDERIDRLEAAVAGGMAAHTKELHKVATILDTVAKKLEIPGGTR